MSPASVVIELVVPLEPLLRHEEEGKHTSLMVVSGFGSWYRTYSFTYAVDTSTWIFKERVKIFHMVPTQG
jgi:hypothetical protein